MFSKTTALRQAARHGALHALVTRSWIYSLKMFAGISFIVCFQKPYWEKNERKKKWKKEKQPADTIDRPAVGSPCSHPINPWTHNHCYTSLGYPSIYLYPQRKISCTVCHALLACMVEGGWVDMNQRSWRGRGGPQHEKKKCQLPFIGGMRIYYKYFSRSLTSPL